MSDEADANINAAFQRLLANPLQSDEWRAATVWIVNTIDFHLGSDWFSRALGGDDPICNTVWYFPAHRDVFLLMLTLAIGLNDSAASDGFAKLRNAVRTDMRQSLLRHTILTLETAAFARDTGSTVAFEVTERDYKNPIDLRLDCEEFQIPVEARVILVDAAFRRQDDAVVHLQSVANRVAFAHDVALEITLHEVPPNVDTVIAMIDEAVHLAKMSRLSIDRQNPTIAILAHPPGSGAPSTFTGPVLGGDTLPRIVAILLAKATKRYGPRPVWLRVELLDGTWALTDWARWPLRDKVLTLAEQIRGALPVGAVWGGRVVRLPVLRRRRRR